MDAENTEPKPDAEVAAWLRAGELVVTASDRASRAITTAFHRARLAEGLTAWTAPNVLAWNRFVRTAWDRYAAEDGRLLLNSTQEQALWASILADREGPHLPIPLEGPRHRLAAQAIEAQDLICSYAPKFLRTKTRSEWQQDAAAFSGWLATFDEICRAGSLLSPSRLPIELISLLEADPSPRPPLLLAGFDRILPVQRSLFDAWGAWREVARDKPTSSVYFYEAADFQSELAACALWCRERLAVNPDGRLLVITQDAASKEHRGEIERAFLRYSGLISDGPTAPSFEFSLGVPLSQVALPKAAQLALRWLASPLAEHELDWLFSTGQIAASPQESIALQSAMRSLRRRSLERPHWTLAEFLRQKPVAAEPSLAPWCLRIIEAQRLLTTVKSRRQSPLDWSQFVPQLLETIVWPGSRPPSSAEFQAIRRWQQAVEDAGSLGFDGCRFGWTEFLSVLARTLGETLFAPESRDASIQIAGPAESAGLSADAVWFLGADEDAWPAGGATHPLLPPEVQREAKMPHATPQLDWDLASAVTTRLLASAPEVYFSYAKQNEAADTRPSRLIEQIAGAPQPLAPELAAIDNQPLRTVIFEDASRIPFPPGKVAGSASVLTAQSQCPFKAFATARLAAHSWQPAMPSLTPSQRGQLLHAVLHAVWAGPPDGIRSHAELLKLKDREAFVAGHVQSVFQQELRSGLRERMPQSYLELEAQRLTRLITEWLDYEATRMDFEVAKTEADRTIQIAGLTFNLRLDRLDRLNDDSLLVIDYKSGAVSPKSWELPRPEDVQLPLYAGFGLDLEKEALGGLVFAKVRPGDLSFAGRVGDAKSTLLANLSSSASLVKNPLNGEQLIDWRNCIEQLARDFLAGRAEVDPREAPKTCLHCGLETLCRILEDEDLAQPSEDDEDEEAALE